MYLYALNQLIVINKMLDQSSVQYPNIAQFLQIAYVHHQIPPKWKVYVHISKFLLPHVEMISVNENFKTLFLSAALKLTARIPEY